MGRLLALIGALVLAALIGWADQRTSRPVPASAPATAFSAERAMADVRTVARTPHPIGTPANHQVRDHLLGRMTAMGLAPEVHVDDAATFRDGKTRSVIYGATVKNLVGVLPGRDRRAPAVMLMAHYDSVPGSPGAADDATGVASALEIVRAIKAQGQPARDVMVLLTDGEESGLLGAQAFFARDPLAKRVGLLLNMESRGGGGRVQMFETSAGNGPLIDLFGKSAVRPAASSLSVFIYEHMPNGTDFTEAKTRGIVGLNYAFLGRQFDYHSPSSTPDNLDKGSLQDMGDQVLAATRAAAFAQTLPAKGEPAVYSQVFGDTILIYPPWAGWIVLLAGAVLCALGVRRARAIEAFPWTDALRGAGAFFFAIVASAAVLHFARKATGVAAGYMEQRFLLAQISVWETAAMLLALGILVLSACELARGRRNIALLPLAAGLASSAFGGFDALGVGLGVAGAVIALLTYSRPVTRPGAWAGVLMAGVVLTALLQALAPATAYLFAWPLLLAGIAAAATAAAARRSVPYVVLLGLICAIGLGWIAGTAHLLFLSLDMPELLAVCVALAALLVWPLAQPEEGAPPARRTGLILLLAGLVVLVVVRESSPYTPRHPRASHVVYELDQDTGRAWRESTFGEVTPWTRQALRATGNPIVKRRVWMEDKEVEAAADRPAALPAPTITLAKAADGALLLTAVPPAGARELYLQMRPNTAVVFEQAGRVPGTLRPAPGKWMQYSWEGAPQGLTLRFRPGGPGAMDVRYLATIDGWPAGVSPLPKRPADEMAFHTSDSTRVTGTRRLAW